MADEPQPSPPAPQPPKVATSPWTVLGWLLVVVVVLWLLGAVVLAVGS
ncbi:MAG: hypothetical protein WBC97_10635 [Gemmatimonadales bacterium]